MTLYKKFTENGVGEGGGGGGVAVSRAFMYQ